MRLSGLQKEVLALYRQCLRECRKKPQVSVQIVVDKKRYNLVNPIEFVIWLTLVEQSTRAHFEKFVR